MREPLPDAAVINPELIREDQGLPVMEAVLSHDAPTVADAGKPQRKREIALWVSAAWVFLVAFMAIFASWLPFVKPYQKIYPTAFKKGPSLEHWFGTDNIGRDVFSRTVYGARLSFTIGATSIVLGLLFGGIIGLAAGYFRGKFDTVSSTIMDVLLAFPALILALSIVSFLQPRFPGKEALFVILALSILSVPPLTRIVRATTMGYSNREFVLAARSLGAKNGRVLRKEILPNVVPSMVSFALTGLAVLIIAEGALAFLGVGVQPPTPTWGKVIAEGQKSLDTAWWISIMPSIVLFLTVLAFNVMGDVFSKRFDIRESSL